MEIQINIKCHYYGIQFIDNTVSGGIINKKIKKRLGSIQFVKALKGQSLEHLIVAPCSLSGGDTVSMNEKTEMWTWLQRTIHCCCSVAKLCLVGVFPSESALRNWLSCDYNSSLLILNSIL